MGPWNRETKHLFWLQKGKIRKEKLKRKKKKGKKSPPSFFFFFFSSPLSLFLCHFYFACGSKMERPTQWCPKMPLLFVCFLAHTCILFSFFFFGNPKLGKLTTNFLGCHLQLMPGKKGKKKKEKRRHNILKGKKPPPKLFSSPQKKKRGHQKPNRVPLKKKKKQNQKNRVRCSP